jgi:uncharacterized protein (TIGR02118 family)
MKQRSDVLGVVLVLLLSGVTISCSAAAEEAEELQPAATEATPGFKFMVLINKLEDISFEEYERYFFEEHLPYVLRIPGLRAYKVNLRHPEDEDAPYDGISEFWFDDRAAFDEAMASPETEATLADAATFLMPPQIFLVDERVVLPLTR